MEGDTTYEKTCSLPRPASRAAKNFSVVASHVRHVTTVTVTAALGGQSPTRQVTVRPTL
jgi:hypothetical protein